MKIKNYQKKETLITFLLIIFYILINSFCINNFGTISYQTLIGNLLLSIFIIVFIIKNNLTKYYGLTSISKVKEFLYFIPLIILIFSNLFSGIKINNTYNEIIIHILIMINIGFLEEIIFRGFLFKMMSKDNLKMAIIVSSLTFGIGHILNIFNGSQLIPTLIQVIYATAVGYLFVIIFHKGKSLWPCIITHIGVNSLSVFSNNNSYLIPLLLTIIPIIYAIYINKTIK